MSTPLCNSYWLEETVPAEQSLASWDTEKPKIGLISEDDFLQFVSKLDSDIQENIQAISVLSSSQTPTSNESLDWISWDDLCSSSPIQTLGISHSTNYAEATAEDLPSLAVPKEGRASKRSRKPGTQFDTKAFWTEENIKKLLHWAHHMKQDWKKIAKKFQTKHVTATVVRNKYRELKNNEAPLRQRFTPEEDLLIAKYYKIYGLQWKKIAEHLKSRTAIMVKNRFYAYIRKNNLLESLIEKANEMNL